MPPNSDVLEDIPRALIDVLTHEDLPALCRVEDSRRRIHRVADDGVLPLVGCAYLPSNYEARVDPDVPLDLAGNVQLDPVDGLHDLERGADRPLGSSS